jgi:hypothetical protein
MTVRYGDDEIARVLSNLILRLPATSQTLMISARSERCTLWAAPQARFLRARSALRSRRKKPGSPRLFDGFAHAAFDTRGRSR